MGTKFQGTWAALFFLAVLLQAGAPAICSPSTSLAAGNDGQSAAAASSPPGSSSAKQESVPSYKSSHDPLECLHRGNGGVTVGGIPVCTLNVTVEGDSLGGEYLPITCHSGSPLYERILTYGATGAMLWYSSRRQEWILNGAIAGRGRDGVPLLPNEIPDDQWWRVPQKDSDTASSKVVPVRVAMDCASPQAFDASGGDLASLQPQSVAPRGSAPPIEGPKAPAMASQKVMDTISKSNSVLAAAGRNKGAITKAKGFDNSAMRGWEKHEELEVDRQISLGFELIIFTLSMLAVAAVIFFGLLYWARQTISEPGIGALRTSKCCKNSDADDDEYLPPDQSSSGTY